jgi:hypothetical protein
MQLGLSPVADSSARRGDSISLFSIKNDKNARFWFFGKHLVLWSFKPGTYQTGSFAELTPKFQACGTRSRKFWATSPTPNDWDPCAAYRFYCTRACATWWLTRFDWLSHNGAQSHRHKKERKSSDDFVRALGITHQEELWRFRKSSRDNCWLAIPRPSDLRHKKCHIYR